MIRKISTGMHIKEIGGEKIEGRLYYQTNFVVESHWDNDGWVVFKVEGKEYTLDAKEVNKAVNNAIYWRVK